VRRSPNAALIGLQNWIRFRYFEVESIRIQASWVANPALDVHAADADPVAVAGPAWTPKWTLPLHLKYSQIQIPVTTTGCPPC
jgi:hypothetical protein